MNKRGRDEYESEVGFIMCGLPGNMGIEVSNICIKNGLYMLPIGITSRARGSLSLVCFCFLFMTWIFEEIYFIWKFFVSHCG